MAAGEQEPTLLEFAQEMNRMALAVYGATGGNGRVAELALALADRASTVKQAEQMRIEREKVGTGDLDLKQLSVNLEADATEPFEHQASQD